MSDSPPPPAAPEKPKGELLDKIAVKFILSLLAWLAPLPVSVVMLKFYFSHFAQADQSNTDPFQSLHRTMTSFNGSVPDLIFPLALLPSILLLAVLYHTGRSRLLAIAALVFFAVGEVVAMIQVYGMSFTTP